MKQRNFSLTEEKDKLGYIDKLIKDPDIKELCYKEIEARDTPVHWDVLTSLWTEMCNKLGWKSIGMDIADEVLQYHEANYKPPLKEDK